MAQPKDTTEELLRDLLIVELGKAGVPQQEIRKIVRCSLNRVNSIVKVLRKAKPKPAN